MCINILIEMKNQFLVFFVEFVFLITDVVVVKIWESNQQSELLLGLGAGPRLKLGDLHNNEKVIGRGEAAQNPSGV